MENGGRAKCEADEGEIWWVMFNIGPPVPLSGCKNNMRVIFWFSLMLTDKPNMAFHRTPLFCPFSLEFYFSKRDFSVQVLEKKYKGSTVVKNSFLPWPSSQRRYKSETQQTFLLGGQNLATNLKSFKVKMFLPPDAFVCIASKIMTEKRWNVCLVLLYLCADWNIKRMKRLTLYVIC